MNLEDALGIDPASPSYLRAVALAEEDHRFLRKLVELRKESGLTQDDVARLLGKKQSSIASFESYDNDPKLSTIRRYAQAVGLLIEHKVSRDVGQLNAETVRGWAGGWEPVAASRVNPTVLTIEDNTRQVRASASETLRASWVLAA